MSLETFSQLLTLCLASGRARHLCASSTVWMSPGMCGWSPCQLGVSALGRGLCSGEREERQSPEPGTATALLLCDILSSALSNRALS